MGFIQHCEQIFGSKCGIKLHNNYNNLLLSLRMDPQLFELRQDLFALIPTNKLKFPENLSLSRLNDFFLNNILLDCHFQKYPPSEQYQIGLWKWVIQHLEELGGHISEEVRFTSQENSLVDLFTDRKTKLLRQYMSIMLV